VAALPPRPAARSALEPQHHPHGTVHRPYRRNRAVMELRDALLPLAHDAMDGVNVDVLSRAATGAPTGLPGLVALTRSRRHDVDPALRAFLTEGDLAVLWEATAVRPLATALAGLDPELRGGRLDLLLEDTPLPASPRRLARVPGILEARAVEVVARRLRRALGRLVLAGDPGLAPLVPRDAGTGLLCALVLLVSTVGSNAATTHITRRGDLAVPGFPASTLDNADGPWRRAGADAAELGAELHWHLPMALVVPSDWLGRGGWPALWARAHRNARADDRVHHAA